MISTNSSGMITATGTSNYPSRYSIRTTFPLQAKQAARHTLINVLESILRLLHPIMPYITEELWQRVARVAGIEAPTIMRRDYPQADAAQIDRDAVDELEWVKAFIMGVRQIRSEMDIKPGKPVPVLCQHGSDLDRQRIERNQVLAHAAGAPRIHHLARRRCRGTTGGHLAGRRHAPVDSTGRFDRQGRGTGAPAKKISKNWNRMRPASAPSSAMKTSSPAPRRMWSTRKRKNSPTTIQRSPACARNCSVSIPSSRIYPPPAHRYPQRGFSPRVFLI